MEYQHRVEALTSDGPDEPLSERVRTGRSNGRSDGPETCHQIQRPGDQEDLADDGNRTARMEGTLLADGAEQESLEATQAPRADNE
jgi:hypothetical protein